MKQGFLTQEMASLNEVTECINDWQSEGCRFVFTMEGKTDASGIHVYHFNTYGDLPKDMEMWSEIDEENWSVEPEYQRMKAWWEKEYGKKTLRVCVGPMKRAEMLVEALEKAGVKHGEIKSEYGQSPKCYEYFVEVPDEGGAHYLEELVNMNCNPELIEKFAIKEV